MSEVKNNKFRQYFTCIRGIMLVILISFGCVSCKKKPVVPGGNDTPNNSTGPEYTIGTFNIRRTTAADTENRRWLIRRPLAAMLIKTYNFDIFGVQEPIGTQIDDMVNDLPEYSRFGVSDHNDYSYQHQDIFYRKSKFTLLTSGKFWLAPGGPELPPADTTPWDNYYHSEVATWGKFEDKTTGFQFYVFNAHFEPGAPIAQAESAKLVLDKMNSIAGSSPAMFTGDLNSDQHSDSYNILQNSSLLEDSYVAADTRSPVVPTFNNWKTNPVGESRIDHIFITSHFQVKSHKILTDNYNQILPSDHFPVLIGISRKP